MHGCFALHCNLLDSECLSITCQPMEQFYLLQLNIAKAQRRDFVTFTLGDFMLTD